MPLVEADPGALTKLKPEIEGFVASVLGKLNTLVGHDIVLQTLKVYQGGTEDFFKEFKRRRFLFTRIAWESHGGEMIGILNSINTAIAMAGYMWNLPAATISTKIKAGDLDTDLQGVYKEISNLMFNAVSQHIADRGHAGAQLAFTTEDLPANGKKNQLVDAGRYVMILTDVSVGEQQPAPLYFFIAEPIISSLFAHGKDLIGGAVETGGVGKNPDAVPVEQVMISEYPVIGEDKTISDAYELMVKRRLEHLPIVDEEGRVLRVISKNDIEIMKSVFFDAPGVQARSARVMCVTLSEVNKEQKLVSLKPGDSLGAAVRLMAEHRLHCVPVIEEDRQLAGMVTSFLVFDWLAPPRGKVRAPARNASVEDAFDVLMQNQPA